MHCAKEPTNQKVGDKSDEKYSHSSKEAQAKYVETYCESCYENEGYLDNVWNLVADPKEPLSVNLDEVDDLTRAELFVGRSRDSGVLLIDESYDCVWGAPAHQYVIVAHMLPNHIGKDLRSDKDSRIYDTRSDRVPGKVVCISVLIRAIFDELSQF